MNNKYSDIQNTYANIDSKTDWRLQKFSHPERTIRLATSFSGIGAIEHSMHRLGLKCQIQFAGDIDANCKKHISQIIQYLKNNGIPTYTISMQSHTKAKWIYLWVEPRAKHFRYVESMEGLKIHEVPYFVNLPV